MAPGRCVSAYFFINLSVSISTYLLEILSYALVLHYIYDLGNDRSIFWTLLLVAGIPVIATQILSLHWSLWKTDICGKKCGFFELTSYILIHVLQFGVFYRYVKLMFCRDVTDIDDAMAEATLLRLFHAFSGGLPCLFFTGYLTLQNTMNWPLVLVVVSGLCANSWALASYSRHGQLALEFENIRTAAPALILKTLWRLGEISARVLAGVLFATAYGHWIFFVIGLHWAVMFIWLFVLDVLDRRIDKRRPLTCRSVLLNAGSAFIHIFCFLNVHVTKQRYKVVCFYIVTYAETVILFTAWVLYQGPSTNLFWFSALVVTSGTIVSAVSMILYHKYFTITLSPPTPQEHTPEICINCKLSVCVKHGTKSQRPFNTNFTEMHTQKLVHPLLVEIQGNKKRNEYVDFNRMVPCETGSRRCRQNNPPRRHNGVNRSISHCPMVRKNETGIQGASSQQVYDAILRPVVNRDCVNCDNDGPCPEGAGCFSKGQNPLYSGDVPLQNCNNVRVIRALSLDNRSPGVDKDSVKRCRDSGCEDRGHTARKYAKRSRRPSRKILDQRREGHAPHVVTAREHSSRPITYGSDGFSNCTPGDEILNSFEPEATRYPIYDCLENCNSDGEECLPGGDVTTLEHSSEDDVSVYVRNFSFSAFSQSPAAISRLRVSSDDSGVYDSKLPSPQCSSAGSDSEYSSTVRTPEMRSRSISFVGSRSRQPILSLGLSFRSICDTLSHDPSMPIKFATLPRSSLTTVTSLSINDFTGPCGSRTGSKCTDCETKNSIFGEGTLNLSEYSTILASADQGNHLDISDRFSGSSSETDGHWYESITTTTSSERSARIPFDSESTIYENPDFILYGESSA